MSIVCVTNDMPDARSCTVRGEHHSNCDGFDYRWNADRERYEYSGRECRGCLPVEARNGHLCDRCDTQWQEASNGYGKLVKALTGVSRAVQRDNGGVASSTLGYVPLSGIEMMFDELESYRKGATPNNLPGAMQAIRFSRAYRSAVRSHPIEEKAHRIDSTRCPHCNQLRLVWNPTEREGGAVSVKCSNPECTELLDQAMFEVETMRQLHNVTAPVLEGGQPVNIIPEHAEPYAPEREEHQGFDPMMLHTVRELRDIARDLDIPTSGTKRALIDSIAEARREVVNH